MRIFALSDLHVDYEENRRWLHNLSRVDYQADLLILAGDISDMPALQQETFTALRRCFAAVVFVPGNHDLWVHRTRVKDSLAQFELIRQMAADYGIAMQPVHRGPVSIVPLLGWYDYSFGQPSPAVRRGWLDYSACQWPDGLDAAGVTRHFLALNEPHLSVANHTLISFSHFLPRIDLMPFLIPPHKRGLYPVLGTARLDEQIRALTADIHIYGHSHINMRTYKDGVIYINNAFGYPHETRHTARQLFCVYSG